MRKLPVSGIYARMDIPKRGMSVKLKDLHMEDIEKAAKQNWPDFFIRVDTADLFLEGIADGCYTADFIDGEFYVSTQYAYENILVNGNKTSYKISVYTVERLKDASHINYRWDDCFYAVYEDENGIQFMEYPEFLKVVKERVRAKST